MARALVLKVRRLESALRPRPAALPTARPLSLEQLRLLASDLSLWDRFCLMAETKDTSMAGPLAVELAAVRRRSLPRCR